MKINTKTRYGIRTMIETAMHQTGHNSGILQKEIARKQHISEKYLDQIIASLKASGLIKNAGGKKSGYVLNASPYNISVYDIFQAFNANLKIVECLEQGSEYNCSETCPVHDYWYELNDIIILNMKNKTLSELVTKQKALSEQHAGQDYQI